MLSKDERLDFRRLLSRHKLIPVASFPDSASALRVAEMLVRHSFGVLEVVLRVPSALECIAAVRREFPDLAVGAGSVLSAEMLYRATEAGAAFCVAPCCDAAVVRAAAEAGIEFMPGIATPTELSAAVQCGANLIKVFPAAPLGGPAYIAALAGPFAAWDFVLVPTGGITEDNFDAYLSLDRVIACGASSVVDSSLLAEGNFTEISRRIVSFAERLVAAYPRGSRQSGQ